MKKKVENRKIRLEELAQQGRVFCEKHQGLVDVYTVRSKKCYTGNRGKTYCPHLVIRE